MPLQNWSGNVRFSTDRLLAPHTVEALQEIVAGSARIRALGTGHSFSRVADSPGALVTVRQLPAALEIDEERGRATVPAGATYAEVATALHARGWALHNLGSLPHISVAGACATGTHGSGNGNRCLAAAAVGIRFVRGDGELVELDDAHPDFPGTVVALGALGVVTHLTLAVEPAYEVAQEVWLDAALDTVLEQYEPITSAGYSVSFFRGPDAGERIDQIWIKRRGGSRTDGNAWGARPAAADVHPIAGLDARAATVQRGVPGPWHQRLPHFRADFTPSAGDEQQSEYLVPREHGVAAIAAVARLDLSRALQVAEFRTVAADDLWLSPACGRATAALHFTWHNDDVAVREAVDRVEAAVAQFDPRPHWGKVFAISPEEVAARYPRLADFRALVERYDPHGTFANAFLERYVYA